MDDRENEMSLESAKEMINLFVENQIDNLVTVLKRDHPYEIAEGTVGDIEQAWNLINHHYFDFPSRDWRLILDEKVESAFQFIETRADKEALKTIERINPVCVSCYEREIYIKKLVESYGSEKMLLEVILLLTYDDSEHFCLVDQLDEFHHYHLRAWKLFRNDDDDVMDDNENQLKISCNCDFEGSLFDFIFLGKRLTWDTQIEHGSYMIMTLKCKKCGRIFENVS